MKSSVTASIVGLLACSILTAYAASKEDIQAAVKKLGADSYAWKTTVKVPEGGQGGFRPGPTEGKYAKDGTVCISMTMRDTTTEAFIKGEKGAVKMDDGWKSFEELAAAGGGGQPSPASFRGRMFRNFKAPSAQAEALLEGAQDLKEVDGACVADLKEDAVKKLMTFGGRPGGQAPEPKGAKGSVKFWLKDGALVKYEFNVQGTVTGRDNNEMKVDRTTTVEIKDLGTAKVEVPEEVKKKL
jgi:hypothetical protein